MALQRFYIGFRLDKSTSAMNPLYIMMYQKDKREYGEHRYYDIVTLPNGERRLDPKHRKLENPGELLPQISPGDNWEYNFVIDEVIDKDGIKKPRLKIAVGGSHYLLANEADTVLASGVITFKDKKVASIRSKSGGYHRDLDKLTRSEREIYKAELMQLFEEVELPSDKYNVEYFIEAEKGAREERGKKRTLMFRALDLPETKVAVKPRLDNLVLQRRKAKKSNFYCCLFATAATAFTATAALITAYNSLDTDTTPMPGQQLL